MALDRARIRRVPIVIPSGTTRSILLRAIGRARRANPYRCRHLELAHTEQSEPAAAFIEPRALDAPAAHLGLSSRAARRPILPRRRAGAGLPVSGSARANASTPIAPIAMEDTVPIGMLGHARRRRRGPAGELHGDRALVRSVDEHRVSRIAYRASEGEAAEIAPPRLVAEHEQLEWRRGLMA
jgi:hypothetical protein